MRAGHLVDTLLDDRFVGFAARRHQLCALGLNNVELLLQSINLLFESLRVQWRKKFKSKTTVTFYLNFPIRSANLPDLHELLLLLDNGRVDPGFLQLSQQVLAVFDGDNEGAVVAPELVCQVQYVQQLGLPLLL